MLKQSWALVFLVCLVGGITGCGQKGDLYLPTPATALVFFSGIK